MPPCRAWLYTCTHDPSAASWTSRVMRVGPTANSSEPWRADSHNSSAPRISGESVSPVGVSNSSNRIGVVQLKNLASWCGTRPMRMAVDPPAFISATSSADTRVCIPDSVALLRALMPMLSALDCKSPPRLRSKSSCARSRKVSPITARRSLPAPTWRFPAFLTLMLRPDTDASPTLVACRS